MELKLNWILYGFKRVGKSKFAKRLPLPEIDTDTLIAKRCGLSIPTLVETRGWKALRTLEQQLLSEIKVNHHIISIGGGTPLDEKNLAILRRLGKLIYLTAPKSLIQKRQLAPPLPKYIDPKNPKHSFENMWSKRISIYKKISDFRVDIYKKTDTQILEELWQIINLETSFVSLLGENLTEKPSVL